MNIKIIIKVFKDFWKLLWQYIQYLFYKDKEKYKNAWLFCERGIDAGDNAYVFFKYIRRYHPEIKAYYIIDTNDKELLKQIKKFGDVIKYNSYEHRMAFMGAKVYICTHYGFITKCNYRIYKTFFGKNKRYIFLQHGITQNDLSKVMNNLILPLDIFVTSTKEEYNSIINNKNYKYSKNVVKLTGLARFDNLNNILTENYILYMPTWRNYLAPLNGKVETEKFLGSDYYKNINKIINDDKLLTFLKRNNYKLIFYPHHEIQRYISLFKQQNDNIIVGSEKEFNVQDLLKRCKFLITDYSSIHFDFAYMKKPLVYYQFDQEKFYSHQYVKGYFDCYKCGFGPVFEDSRDVVNYTIKICKDNKCLMGKKYLDRVNKTFEYNDDKNCERIYNEIVKKIKGEL